MFKSEDELMEELALSIINESIFSGNVDEGSDDKDESEEDEDDKDTKSEDSEDSDDEKDEKKDSKDSDDDDNDSDDDDDKDSDDGDSDDEDSDDEDSKGSKSDGPATGPFTSKIRTLQKQYNDLLVDAFEKYAPECIEDALDETESSFGENIEDILQDALDRLKNKILGDLGVEGTSDLEGMMMPPEAMGSFDPTAATNNPMEISIEKG